LIDFLTILVGT